MGDDGLEKVSRVFHSNVGKVSSLGPVVVDETREEEDGEIKKKCDS